MKTVKVALVPGTCAAQKPIRTISIVGRQTQVLVLRQLFNYPNPPDVIMNAIKITRGK